MLIICAVAADFVNSDGDVFSVKGKEIGVIKEAPDWITSTLLFKWLNKDGSIKFVEKTNRIEAENAPLAGLSAEGKKPRDDGADEKIDPVSEEPEASVTKKQRKPRQKKKDDAE